MAKLTDTQLIIMSNAAQRDDGAAIPPDRLNVAARVKVETSLVGRKLMRVIRAKPGMPRWREDSDGRGVSLIITRAGRNAIGVEEDDKALTQASTGADGGHDHEVAKRDPDGCTDRRLTGAEVRDKQPAGVMLRPGTKQALIVDMLSSDTGTTLDSLMRATGWLRHTTRAALTGLRRRGYRIERFAGNGEHPSTWRIVTDAKLAA